MKKKQKQKQNQGPLGHFVGRIGNVVYYILNGQPVGRFIGVVSHYTEKQEEVRMRTTVVSPFLKRLKAVINIGFKNTPKPQNWSWSNMAVSVNNPGAVKGAYPDLEMNYEEAILSMGEIPPPKHPEVKLNGKVLEFRWEPDLIAEGAAARDQIMVVAFFPELMKAMFITSGARRTEGIESFNLPNFRKDTVIETYMAFNADDRTDVSNSVYTGQLIWKGGQK